MQDWEEWPINCKWWRRSEKEVTVHQFERRQQDAEDSDDVAPVLTVSNRMNDVCVSEWVSDHFKLIRTRRVVARSLAASYELLLASSCTSHRSPVWKCLSLRSTDDYDVHNYTYTSVLNRDAGSDMRVVRQMDRQTDRQTRSVAPVCVNDKFGQCCRITFEQNDLLTWTLNMVVRVNS